jgi:2,3-bisphosphoglycerate-independent phosphoglycerate mutase
MKYALIIPDGCADEPQESLGGRTPLQAANVPHMDAIAAAGVVGRAVTVPASLPAGSDVGTMSLFGYDPLKYHTGRAPIEAAAQGIELGSDDWAIRCNLVTIEDGVMRSFTAGQVPNDVAAKLIERLQQDQCGSPHWKFHAGVSYRNLLIYRSRGTPALDGCAGVHASSTPAPFTSETRTTPPHDVTDQPVAPFLPAGPGSELLRELMDRSVALFAESDADAERRARDGHRVTGIWLWGLGKALVLPTFEERFGVRGAVVTAVDLLRGMGRVLGWDVLAVKGATGYLDTDYAAKGRAAIDALHSGTDLVVVHVEATDEASHEGDAAAKVASLERIDAEIVGPVHESLKSQGDYRIAVSPDHPTFLRTRTHSHGPVPFAMCGTGIHRDALSTYDEPTAALSPIAIAGHELMPSFIAAGLDGAAAHP